MNGILLYVLESAVCLILFYIGYWVFLKRETFFALNRVYLVSSLIASFLLPLLKIPSPFRTTVIASSTFPVTGSLDLPSQSPGIPFYLFIIYMVVAGILLLRFIFKLAVLFLAIRKNGVRKCGDLRIVYLNKRLSPFSFFHYIFLNNEKISDSDLDRIFAHERAHIHQYHSLDIVLLELATICQWFNPFVWPYKKTLKETHEYLADHAVIAQGCNRASYQMLIFEQHVGVKLFEFTNNFKHSNIKRRITMMSKMRSRNRAKLKFLLFVPLAALLVIVFAQPQVVTEETHTENLPAMENQQKEDDSKAEEEKKIELEKIKQAEEKLKVLTKKEDEIRKEMETVEDQDKKLELKKNLQAVLEKKEAMSHFLQESMTYNEEYLEFTVQKIEEEMRLIKEKGKVVQEKLKTFEEDDENREELEDLLKKLQVKHSELGKKLEKLNNLIKEKN